MLDPHANDGDQRAALLHLEALRASERASRAALAGLTSLARAQWLEAAEQEARAAELSSHGSSRGRYYESAAGFAARAGETKRSEALWRAAAESLAAAD